MFVDHATLDLQGRRQLPILDAQVPCEDRELSDVLDPCELGVDLILDAALDLGPYGGVIMESLLEEATLCRKAAAASASR